VSKTLLTHLGLDFSRMITSSGAATVISGIFGGAAGLLSRFGTEVLTGIGATASTTTGAGNSTSSSFIGGVDRTITPNGDGTFTQHYRIGPPTIARNATSLGIDAQKKDGIVRVLAEPNIMAICGLAASFLSGGKIFIPVAQSNATGGSTITLEERNSGWACASRRRCWTARAST
jgi:pilus assembly protein CpaC